MTSHLGQPQWVWRQTPVIHSFHHCSSPSHSDLNHCYEIVILIGVHERTSMMNDIDGNNDNNVGKALNSLFFVPLWSFLCENTYRWQPKLQPCYWGKERGERNKKTPLHRSYARSLDWPPQRVASRCMSFF